MSEGNRHEKKIQLDMAEVVSSEKYGAISENYIDIVVFLKTIFQENDPVSFREVQADKKGNVRACLVFCEGLVNTELIDNHLLRPLMEKEVSSFSNADMLLSKVFQMLSVKRVTDYNEIINGILYGETAVIIEGLNEVLLFDTKSFNTRAVSEPEGEKILSGPREGFTEALLMNLSLLRRKVRTEKLKMRYMSIGDQTKTQICIAYLDGVSEPEVLKELYARLNRIRIDGILDANYINELIRDNAWSPFRSTGYTERPDVVAAKLLEGRVAIFIDGTPVVLTLPYLFIENFQSNEDYYLSFYFTTFSRFLRILGFFLTVLLPGIYIAVVAFHHEVLPSALLISIAAERQSVPLPAALEAVVMIIIFEILRETSLRMSANVGQTLGIVGALVVGQAAVEAKLIAAPMIIIIAMTGITSLLVPKMNAPILIIRFGILLLASWFGFLGVTIGVAFTFIHMLDLRSFGVSQLSGMKKIDYQGIKDTIIRAPWYQMLLRPKQLTGNVTRQKQNKEDTK